MTLTHITSFQIVGALIVACIGFLFRLGLEFKEIKKMPKMVDIFILSIFSFGLGALMFLYIIGKDFNLELKLLLICAASFFGSVIVPGVGAIKPSFFTAVAKDVIRKWVNGQQQNSQQNDSIADGENEENTEVQQTSESDGDLEQ